MMALKTGIICCMQTAWRCVQPVLSTATAVTQTQRGHLSTLRMLPYISNSAPAFTSDNHISEIHREKLTLCHLPSPANVHVRNYHSVLKPRLHCKGCYFVWRHGRKYVECSDVPSHKQMKKVITRKLWKEDYTKGNVRKAMMWHRDMMQVSDRSCDRDALSHNWMASRIGKDV